MKAQIINNLLTKGLLEMGAKTVPEKNFCGTNSYDVTTLYGLLTVTLDKQPTRGKKATYSCFGRFADHAKAKDHVPCNPYTGKYNWCVFAKDFTPERFAASILGDIRGMLDIT